MFSSNNSRLKLVFLLFWELSSSELSSSIFYKKILAIVKSKKYFSYYLKELQNIFFAQYNNKNLASIFIFQTCSS